jgi:pimeloyl-ACP methyl ester carboxylesterase
MVCRESGCATDPAQDLAQVVRTRHNGPPLLNTLIGLTSGKPRLGDVPTALHDAALGEYTKLDAIIAAEQQHQAITADKFSQGLHTSTVCADLLGPWGDAATPLPPRAAATAKAAVALPEQSVFPYDRDTAAGNGTLVICQQWPPTPVIAFPVGRDLPPVPVLLLAGDHDLNTPLAWTQQEAARAPHGQLIIIPGAGHITQDAANGPAGRAAVAKFLTNS